MEGAGADLDDALPYALGRAMLEGVGLGNSAIFVLNLAINVVKIFRLFNVLYHAHNLLPQLCQRSLVLPQVFEFKLCVFPFRVLLAQPVLLLPNDGLHLSDQRVFVLQLLDLDGRDLQMRHRLGNADGGPRRVKIRLRRRHGKQHVDHRSIDVLPQQLANAVSLHALQTFLEPTSFSTACICCSSQLIEPPSNRRVLAASVPTRRRAADGTFTLRRATRRRRRRCSR